ncbi:16061_t:CDS:1, partial [Racocetra persica]
TEFVSGLVFDKIYYYSGYDGGAMRYNDFFYIDLKQSFSSSSPPYQFIKNSLELYDRIGAATVSHANKLYAFGGDTPLPRLCKIQSLSMNPEVVYIPNTFSTPSLRKWHTFVIDHMNEKIYVWGGVNETSMVMNFSFLSSTKNDGNMYIFDIVQSVWTSNLTPNQPNGRCLHTATFVPDGWIIMIGGATNPDVGN